MQYKPQDSIKHRASAKPPPAAGGPTPMRHRRISGRDLPGTGSKGLATVLYGINEGSCGLSTVDKLRRQQMIKEILIRRALSPPPTRFTLRWKNFRPTPSRLSTICVYARDYDLTSCQDSRKVKSGSGQQSKSYRRSEDSNSGCPALAKREIVF
ncbi:hypothetical protein Cgig2_026238 [Carnegiea gigantea]|uniref:Uncharacterized protein n=1 Tax=Carnegiea gigantea TaxID=171969 RepID=A0A9Q1KII3_9CARY|nr:hypothetical protein Cgig2_026238 [Carnegiea gigantea]